MEWYEQATPEERSHFPDSYIREAREADMDSRALLDDEDRRRGSAFWNDAAFLNDAAEFIAVDSETVPTNVQVIGNPFTTPPTQAEYWAAINLPPSQWLREAVATAQDPVVKRLSLSMQECILRMLGDLAMILQPQTAPGVPEQDVIWESNLLTDFNDKRPWDVEALLRTPPND